MRNRLRFLCGSAVLASGLAGSAPAAPPPDMEATILQYRADLFSVSGFYDLPWSPTCFDRKDRLFRDWRGRLEAMPFDELDTQGRVDYLLLHTRLGTELSDQTQDRRRLAEMADLLPFREPIQTLEEARWRMEPFDSEGAAARLSGLPERIKQVRDRIEKGRKAAASAPEKKTAEAGKPAAAAARPAKDEAAPLKVSPTVALRASEAVGALRRALRTWFTFYDGFTPDFSWWVRKPHEAADKELEAYGKYLREEIAGQKGKDEDPLIGDPIGEPWLKASLAGEMLAYTPQEIVAIGERELAWCEAEMRKAARELGFAEDWKAALAKVKSSFVAPGGQDELVAQQAREAIRFVKQNELVTVPPLCEETWRLTMVSPERQKTMPYAAYGGQEMMVAYANDTMKHDEKLMSMRGNNRHFSRIVTAHELIPGHHLERFQSSRHRSYRSLFNTPFFVEGWGLYWEFRLWDLNYAKTPADRIGMLFWRMNRAVRIIVSFRFHLGTMTPAEMVNFLVERVGHERSGATGEVRRYLRYPPLYQAAYMMGGLQLHALHREAVGSGRLTEKAFHDAVLACHSIPIEMVRAIVLERKPARDFQPRWRFADAPPPTP